MASNHWYERVKVTENFWHDQKKLTENVHVMLQVPKNRKMRIQKSPNLMIFGPIACFRRRENRFSGQNRPRSSEMRVYIGITGHIKNHQNFKILFWSQDCFLTRKSRSWPSKTCDGTKYHQIWPSGSNFRSGPPPGSPFFEQCFLYFAILGPLKARFDQLDR